jgi:hypothetical protein
MSRSKSDWSKAVAMINLLVDELGADVNQVPGRR